MINDGNYITIQGWMRTDLKLSGKLIINTSNKYAVAIKNKIIIIPSSKHST